ncbi:hypothetical protein EKO23_21745 [Nocardioides guangzhouensis]|uniref:Galactose oxidase n=1 Tax=Nocardioides guangzhouensis TaxID=2497878 RepID=A0A4Q4Z5T6_9ACTN|nr:kelch repeat-containing protein [Nocardioides guangzhouensis]RYP82431.1 hypothetical protein EKO23_21745 [Nocardioides guangzhouensis]
MWRRRGAAGLLVLALSGTAAGCTDASDDGQDAPDATGVLADLASRAAHTMTPVPGGAVLVAGGCVIDGCGSATRTAYLLDGGEVTRVPDLARARDAHTAVALADGRVLVAGGFPAEGEPALSSAELFDPATRTWQTTGAMATGRGGHVAALLADGRVLVAGGWVGPGRFTASTEIYDPRHGRFEPGPPLPQALDGLAAAALPDGCALLTGGRTRADVATRTAVRVCPDGRLHRVPPLDRARCKHAMVTLDDGRVLVVGGTPDDRRLLVSTEVYDARTRSFSPGPDLRTGRYKLAGSVVALPGGRAFVAGGGKGAEVVDVPAHQSTLVDAFSGEPRSFSTVGLTEARVVLVGGYDEEIRLTRTLRSLPVAALPGEAGPDQAPE